MRGRGEEEPQEAGRVRASCRDTRRQWSPGGLSSLSGSGLRWVTSCFYHAEALNTPKSFHFHGNLILDNDVHLDFVETVEGRGEGLRKGETRTNTQVSISLFSFFSAPMSLSLLFSCHAMQIGPRVIRIAAKNSAAKRCKGRGGQLRNDANLGGN